MEGAHRTNSVTRASIIEMFFRFCYYHQMMERFFPKYLQDEEMEMPSRKFSVLSNADSELSLPYASNESTMVEKTVEVRYLNKIIYFCIFIAQRLDSFIFSSGNSLSERFFPTLNIK